MSHATRSGSVATADKNDSAKLLGLREVGVPRIGHDSSAKVIHSKLFSGVCCAVALLIALSRLPMRGERRCSGAGDPAMNAIYKRVCCTLVVVSGKPRYGL